MRSRMYSVTLKVCSVKRSAASKKIPPAVMSTLRESFIMSMSPRLSERYTTVYLRCKNSTVARAKKYSSSNVIWVLLACMHWATMSRFEPFRGVVRVYSSSPNCMRRVLSIQPTAAYSTAPNMNSRLVSESPRVPGQVRPFPPHCFLTIFKRPIYHSPLPFNIPYQWKYTTYSSCSQQTVML